MICVVVCTLCCGVVFSVVFVWCGAAWHAENPSVGRFKTPPCVPGKTPALVCVVLLVASVLASVRWLLCGGDGSKNEGKKNDVCNFKKCPAREFYPHCGFD